jgi:hypothetical protein
MKHLTHTHPLEQRIEIHMDVNPIVVIGLDLMAIGINMGGVPMTMAIIALLTCPAHQVTEVGKVRGIEAKMTIGHPNATYTLRECVGVHERG